MNLGMNCCMGTDCEACDSKSCILKFVQNPRRGESCIAARVGT